MTENRTIAAIATGTGGGIGIVRLSGPEAISITGSIFHGKKSIAEMKGYTGALGRVRDDGGELDEAVLFLYRGPHSYTGEDVCELCCHGGSFLLERVLVAAVKAGAVPAAAGEFTKRALQNGKMTLTEAESVAELIAGESRQAVGAALAAMDGALFRGISGITTTLMESAAHISAWIDYPEEDVEEVLSTELSAAMQQCQKKLVELVGGYHSGKLIRDGISAAIVGSPNVGKSTLMNLLAGYEKSIVTDVPGTTRDVIEDRVRLGDLILNLSDTAGIRNTSDVVEKIGVERSVSRLERCDLVLAVFDGAKALTPGDISLLERLDGRLALGLLNKSDLPQAADRGIISAHVCGVLEISAKDGQGVGELETAIKDLVGIHKLENGAAQLQNQRQFGCAVAAINALEQGLEALICGQTLDAVSVSLEEAINALLELTGKNASVEVIDKVFENFCVGK